MDDDQVQKLTTSNITLARKLEQRYGQLAAMMKQIVEVEEQNIQLVDQLLEQLPAHQQLQQEHIQEFQQLEQGMGGKLSRDEAQTAKEKMRELQRMQSSMDTLAKELQEDQAAIQRRNREQAPGLIKVLEDEAAAFQGLLRGLEYGHQLHRALLLESDTEGIEELSNQMAQLQAMLRMKKSEYKVYKTDLQLGLKECREARASLQGYEKTMGLMRQGLETAQQDFAEFQQFCQQVACVQELICMVVYVIVDGTLCVSSAQAAGLSITPSAGEKQ